MRQIPCLQAPRINPSLPFVNLETIAAGNKAGTNPKITQKTVDQRKEEPVPASHAEAFPGL